MEIKMHVSPYLKDSEKNISVPKPHPTGTPICGACKHWEIEKQDTRSAIYDPGVFAPCKVYLIQAPLRFSFRCEKFELWEEE